jgi:hypothetical protein
MTSSRRTRVTLLLYAFCSLYLLPVFPHFLSANELTRWAAVAGFVDRGSFDVAWATPLIGPPMDVARHGAHLYSNKAPGLTFLSIPAYLAARPFLGPPTTGNLRWSLTVMRVATVTLPGLLLGLLMARSTRDDSFAVVSLLFATPVFVFGTVYFSHVTATALLYGAYLLALRGPSGPHTLGRVALAGFLAGLAVVTEYPAALGVVILGAVLLFGRDRGKRLAAYGAGGLPWAVGLALYNRAMFGSLVSISTANEAAANLAAQASHGIFGVVWPTLSGLSTILTSPSRGLLFFSPVLVLGVVALVPRSVRAPDAWFRFLFVVLLVVAMGGYPMNHGGWGVSARYLILTLPFIVEAAHDRGVVPGFLSTLLLAFSVVLCVVPALTFPLVPELFRFVHAGFSRPLLEAGFATPNLGWFVTPGLASLLPVALAAGAALAIGGAGAPRRTFAAALVGVALAAGVVFAPVQDTPVERATRALFLDSYFRPADRLGALARATSNPTERAELEELRTLVPGTRRVGPDDWPYGAAARPATRP